MPPPKLDQRWFNLGGITKFFLSLIEDKKIQNLVMRASQWLHWQDKTKYCSKCGNKLVQSLLIVEKKCSACSLSFFPKLSPAIIVLIERGEGILLARSPHFSPGMYSARTSRIGIRDRRGAV
jgi:NADH pyrophosphatase NudC (nudix superfamily)